MAFNKIIDVKDQFRQLFDAVTIMYKNAPLNVPCRYAVKSAFDYTEEQIQQVYPVISVYDRGIAESPMFSRTGFVYVANQTNVGTNTAAGTLYYQLMLLTFSFDVGIASKSMLQHSELEEYMIKTVILDYAKLFNEVTIDGCNYGEPIRLKTTSQRIPRNDGVLETNYDISFDAWVQLQDPEDISLINQLNIIIDPESLN